MPRKIALQRKKKHIGISQNITFSKRHISTKCHFRIILNSRNVTSDTVNFISTRSTEPLSTRLLIQGGKKNTQMWHVDQGQFTWESATMRMCQYESVAFLKKTFHECGTLRRDFFVMWHWAPNGNKLFLTENNNQYVFVTYVRVHAFFDTTLYKLLLLAKNASSKSRTKKNKIEDFFFGNVLNVLQGSFGAYMTLIEYRVFIKLYWDTKWRV